MAADLAAQAHTFGGVYALVRRVRKTIFTVTIAAMRTVE
jgi:hypothetical protein